MSHRPSRSDQRASAKHFEGPRHGLPTDARERASAAAWVAYLPVADREPVRRLFFAVLADRGMRDPARIVRQVMKLARWEWVRTDPRDADQVRRWEAVLQALGAEHRRRGALAYAQSLLAGKESRHE